MTQTDKSMVKDVRTAFLKDYPKLASVIDDIIPKKSVAFTMRLKDNDKADLLIINEQIIAFKRMKRWYPTLKIVHKC